MAKSEIIRSPSTGQTKRVFKGQRWIVISQHDEGEPCHLYAFQTREKAERVSAECYRQGDMVHYVEQAEVVAP